MWWQVARRRGKGISFPCWVTQAGANRAITAHVACWNVNGIRNVRGDYRQSVGGWHPIRCGNGSNRHFLPAGERTLIFHSDFSVALIRLNHIWIAPKVLCICVFFSPDLFIYSLFLLHLPSPFSLSLCPCSAPHIPDTNLSRLLMSSFVFLFTF